MACCSCSDAGGRLWTKLAWDPPALSEAQVRRPVKRFIAPTRLNSLLNFRRANPLLMNTSQGQFTPYLGVHESWGRSERFFLRKQFVL